MTIQSIKSKQIEILDKIHFIHKKTQHSTNRTKCGCLDCSKIKSLGEEYEKLGIKRRAARNTKQVGDPRIADIITRKRQLTSEDVDYLLIECLMNHEEASKAIGISRSYFTKCCKNLGMNYHVIKTERRRRHGLVE